MSGYCVTLTAKNHNPQRLGSLTWLIAFYKTLLFQTELDERPKKPEQA